MNAKVSIDYDLNQLVTELLKTPISNLGDFHALWDLHGACRRKDRARMIQLAGRLIRPPQDPGDAY